MNFLHTRVLYWASLVAQMVKNMPAMPDTWLWSLGRADSPGEGNGNPLQYSCLENPMNRGAWRARGSQRVGHDWTINTQNRELPDVQAGFRKGRGTRDQIANIRWIIEKAREFQKNIYFCFIDYVKTLDCADHNTLWKILKEMGIPDHLTCLLRNLYAG